MGFPKFLKSLGQHIAALFNKVHSLDPDKAGMVVSNIAQGAAVALPYLSLVAALTPTGIDDAVVAAVAKLVKPEVVDKFNQLAKEAITTLQTADKNVRAQTKKEIAITLLKTGLTLTITETLANGGKPFNFAGVTISTIEDVAGLKSQTINSVIEMALALKRQATYTA
jgi:hypothetical protein